MSNEMIVAMSALFADIAILGWLVFIWFWGGEHRRCTVAMQCPTCEGSYHTPCKTNETWLRPKCDMCISLGRDTARIATYQHPSGIGSLLEYLCSECYATCGPIDDAVKVPLP